MVLFSFMTCDMCKIRWDKIDLYLNGHEIIKNEVGGTDTKKLGLSRQWLQVYKYLMTGHKPHINIFESLLPNKNFLVPCQYALLEANCTYDLY